MSEKKSRAQNPQIDTACTPQKMWGAVIKKFGVIEKCKATAQNWTASQTFLFLPNLHPVSTSEKQLALSSRPVLGSRLNYETLLTFLDFVVVKNRSLQKSDFLWSKPPSYKMKMTQLYDRFFAYLNFVARNTKMVYYHTVKP